jgi:tRNA nucleotidyltransferase (CCA-adding enzyme)
MTSPFSIPKSVSRITETLEKAGFEAYLVGGCVRDLFLGRVPKDWDVTTNAKPNQIISLFEKTFYENDYGTVGVVNEEESDITLRVIEVTPYRTEGVYSDSRRPDTVSFDATLDDDLKRRDFTINAIALDIDKNVVVDPFFGREDIQKGIIKTVGEPKERFQEDALRMLRAVRIHAEIGFKIEEKTRQGIKTSSNLLGKIAKERIRDEFVRIIMSPNPMVGLIETHELGLLKYISPELEEAIGVEQNKAHSFDVWTHLLKSLQHAADKKLPLHIRLAALFHDISKPETRRRPKEKNEWTFYGHEVVGARKTKEILERLKFPKNMVDNVVKLVRWHMFFSDTEQITLSAVRRLVANVGKENVWDLMNVRMCDRIGTGRPKESPYRLRKYQSMIEEAMRDPVSVGMLAIDGSDVMEVAKIPASPKVGSILHALLEEVLENPAINTKEVLTKKAIKLALLSERELAKRGDSGKEKREEEEEKILKKIRGKYKVK